MKRVRTETGRTVLKACSFLLLFAVLVACRLGGDRGSENSNNRNRATSSSSSSKSEGNEANAKLCKKYESCGCQSYGECMRALENDPNIDMPGLRECMMNSSCQSLCAGKPDGCTSKSGSGTGAGSGGSTNCAAISCTKNSDCPTECYGGCGSSGVCLSF